MPEQRVIILNWLTQLKHLTRATSEPVTRDKLAGYVAMLFADFDDTAFTRESLQAVAQGCEFFPAYSVLKTGLAEWQTMHPAVPRIAYEASESLRLRIEELQDGHAFFRRAADQRDDAKADWSDPAKVRASVANVQNNAAPGMQAILGRMLGNLVQRHAPENLGFVPPMWQPTGDAA